MFMSHTLMMQLSYQYPFSCLNAAFIPARAKKDYEPTSGDSGILETGADLYAHGLAQTICITGTEGGKTFQGIRCPHTYPGPKAWKRRLYSLDVPKDAITVTKSTFPAHTRGDTDALVDISIERKWISAAIITQPHQILRTMLAVLQSLKEYRYTMQIVPVCPCRTNWSKKVYGSQGKLLAPRREHIPLELKRIQEQQANGWLASFKELKTYLDKW